MIAPFSGMFVFVIPAIIGFREIQCIVLDTLLSHTIRTDDEKGHLNGMAPRMPHFAMY
jgi:hypothetical protein